MIVNMLRSAKYIKKYWIFIIAAVTLTVKTTEATDQLRISPREAEIVRYVNDTQHVMCLTPKGGKDTSWMSPGGRRVAGNKGRIHTEERPNMGVALIFESIEAKDKGNYTCSSLINDKPVKLQFKLVVIKPISFLDTPHVQNVSEHKDALVRCEVDGDPKPTIVWHVKGVQLDDSNPNPKAKYEVGGDGLIIRNVSISDRGEYKCRAFQSSNVISDYVDHIITLQIQHKPFWSSGEQAVERHAYVTGVTNLTCDAEADPPAVFEWFKSNKPIVSKTNVTIIKETGSSVLQLVVNNKTFGDYWCTAMNSLGTIKRSFKLREGVKPEKPAHVAMTQTHINTVELTIKGPADKSDSLGYRVQYLIQRHKEPNKPWESAKYADLNKGATYVVPNLEPDTSYVMRVASRNNAGVSDYSPVLSVKTLKQSNAATVTASGASVKVPTASMAAFSLLSTAAAVFYQHLL